MNLFYIYFSSFLQGDGLKFGETSKDPNDNTYVAPGAVSNISLIEYDYSEYYDDVEEEAQESSKKRRDVEDSADSKLVNIAVKEHVWEEDKKIVKEKSMILNKKEYLEKLNGEDKEDKKSSEEDKINMNMIRSVDDKLELSNITIGVADDNITILVENEEENDDEEVEEEAVSANVTESVLEEDVSIRVKREVEELRGGVNTNDSNI